jgi:Transposase
MKKRASASGGCWKLHASVFTSREALMNGDYAGRQVVGMDLHRRRSVLVRMSEDGQKLGTARITNSPAALRTELARAGENPRVVLEAAYGWYWAADTLEAAGAEVHLAHPLGVKAYGYRRVKTDAKSPAAHLRRILASPARPRRLRRPAALQYRAGDLDAERAEGGTRLLIPSENRVEEGLRLNNSPKRFQVGPHAFLE